MVDLTNTGTRAGDEVVQLYLQDVLSSVITYEQVLRGFQRIRLAPGETRTLTFALDAEAMQLLNAQMKWVVEPGVFEVRLGSSSTDLRLKERFEILK